MPSKTCPGTFTACMPGTSEALQAVSEPVMEPAPTLATRARTAAEDKLWQALHAHPNSTAAELSVAAGIGKSTAAKILAVWGTDGSVMRTCGIAEGSRRTADRWTITDIDTSVDIDSTTDAEFTQAPINVPASTDIAKVANEDEDHNGIGSHKNESGVNNAAETATQKLPRLTSGALRGMVEDFLGEHRGEEFSASTIGKALGRSSGAVNNALETLTKTGYAVKTQDAPKRFTAAPQEHPTTTVAN